MLQEKKEGRILLVWRVCLFLEAVLTNHHKLYGLKQQKFMFSQFRRLEDWQGGIPYRGTRGEPVACLFQLLVAVPAFLGLWLPHSNLCLLLQTCSSPLCVFMHLSYKDTCDDTEGPPE